MSTHRKKTIPPQKSLGFGIGYRSIHGSWIESNAPQVDFFEIISENFMSAGGKPRRVLESLGSRFPIVMHGVGLSIGSLEAIRPRYLQELKALVEIVQPRLVSDHLCWTRFNAHNSHDLLPVPFTEESLDWISKKVDQVQELLGRQLLLENPSAYTGHAFDEMTEDEFLKRLAQKTGCGILLDLNNLFVNSQNLGIDPRSYLENIPAGVVGQFHLAGHSVLDEGQLRIDTHDTHVVDEVWQLYRWAVRKWPEAATLIEWDDKIPAFSVLEAELGKAREHSMDSQQNSLPPQLPSPAALQARLPANLEGAVPTLVRYQKDFFNMTVHSEAPNSETIELSILDNRLPVSRLRGMQVYNSAYFLRLRDALKGTFSNLAFVMEDEGFDRVVTHFLQSFPPVEDSISFAGAHLEEFLRSNPNLDYDFGVPLSAMADIAAIEWAQSVAYWSHEVEVAPLELSSLSELSVEHWNSVIFHPVKPMSLLELNTTAHEVIEAIRENRQPDPPRNEKSFVVISRPQTTAYCDALDEGTYEFLKKMLDGSASFYEICAADFESKKDGDTSLELGQVVFENIAYLKTLIQNSLVSHCEISRGSELSDANPHTNPGEAVSSS